MAGVGSWPEEYHSDLVTLRYTMSNPLIYSMWAEFDDEGSTAQYVGDVNYTTRDFTFRRAVSVEHVKQFVHAYTAVMSIVAKSTHEAV